ncbi:sigma-70 family RNA polymerase sigma factor [Fervidibacter sp.]|jgi:RNA polymerase sigma factor (sigma-70 family)
MEELSPKVQKAVQVALHQARQWRRPPHWDGYEWQKELDAIAQAATFEACFYFDEQRGMTLETFVFWQVLTALRDFHRREWAYFAFHCGHLSRVSNEGEAGEGDESAEVCEGVVTKGLEQEWRRYLIFWALERLSERERQVINRLYWDGRTEAEIAHELGISQQAVSKIKQKAIQKLRELLKGLL